MSLKKSLLLLVILVGLTVGFVILSQPTQPQKNIVTKTYSYEEFAK